MNISVTGYSDADVGKSTYQRAMLTMTQLQSGSSPRLVCQYLHEISRPLLVRCVSHSCMCLCEAISCPVTRLCGVGQLYWSVVHHQSRSSQVDDSFLCHRFSMELRSKCSQGSPATGHVLSRDEAGMAWLRGNLTVTGKFAPINRFFAMLISIIVTLHSSPRPRTVPLTRYP
jgi:hypothetical protein